MKKLRRKAPTLSVVHEHAAGIDIGSQFHVCAVSPTVSEQPVQTFDSFTGDLYRMAAWLASCGVTTVAMESTGIYWIPAYEILEGRGFEVFLVNAREAKNVPGRKTDVNDAQWLQKLHQFGLLKASFRPTENIVTLRAYLRQRERLLEFRAAHIQHMQKAMMQMNLQLHHVVADITGVTGMKIIRAILGGEHNPAILANLRDGRCKKSREVIEAALKGNYQPSHLFALHQAVMLFDFYETLIQACDQKLEAQLKVLSVVNPTEPLPKPRHKTKQTNDFSFDVREQLYRIIGVDLTQIHGMGSYLALKLVAECGLDMTRWPTAKHFSSWLCLSPGNKVSGGKVLSAKTRRSSSRARLR